MSTAAERIEKAQQFLKVQGEELDIDIIYFVDWNEEEPDDWTNSYEDIQTLLDDNNTFDKDITYYSTAIEYLREHDASLNDSLAIAEELGYSVSNLNSELLASLLCSQKTREDWSGKEEEFNTFFSELQQEKEEEETEEEEV